MNPSRSLVAEFWSISKNIPVYFIKDETGLNVIGMEGKRPPTNSEFMMWVRYRLSQKEF